MNLPNALTLSRIFLAPVFFLSLFIPMWTGFGFTICYAIAWLLFLYIEISDIVDGHLARSMGLVSDLGKLLDPFSDVISRLTYFVAFVAIPGVILPGMYSGLAGGIMPTWMFLIILYRELGVTFLRTILFNRGIAMAARRGGKAKAILYAISGGSGLLVIGAQGFQFEAGILQLTQVVALISFGLSVLVSAASFIDYVFVFLRLYRESEAKSKL